MNDPERLLSITEDDFERRILRAAARDVGSEESLQRTLSALRIAAGIGAASVASAAVAASPHGAANGLTGAASVGKIVGFLAIGAAAGALSTGSAAWLLAPKPAAAPATSALHTPAPRSVQGGSALRAERSEAAQEVSRETTPGAAHEPPPTPRKGAGGASVRGPLEGKASAALAASDGRRDGLPGSGSAVPEASTLVSELGALESVRAAVDRGRSAVALELLDSYEARFAGGALRPEAAVLRIEALFQRGDRAVATDLAKRFLASHPGSPHAAHLRTLIAKGGTE